MESQKIIKTLPCGKKVIFNLRKSQFNGIVISSVNTIEKGKRKENPLWDAYVSRTTKEKKVELIKNVFGFEDDDQYYRLVLDLKKDFIDLVTAELQDLLIGV